MDYTKLFNKIDSLSTNKLDILSDYNINKQLLTYDLIYVPGRSYFCFYSGKTFQRSRHT